MKKYPIVNGKIYIPQSTQMHMDQHKLDLPPKITKVIDLKGVSRNNPLFDNMGMLDNCKIISHGNDVKSITIKKVL